jgi:hypothetical protein
MATIRRPFLFVSKDEGCDLFAPNGEFAGFAMKKIGRAAQRANH